MLSDLDKEQNENEMDENEMEENDFMDKPLGAPDLLEDALIEQDLQHQGRKFTTHCAIFLVSIIGVALICKWLSSKINEFKGQESQLDIMMKRQIIESPAFKSATKHYDNNICVSYASEEAYMTMMKAKEEQRFNLKARME